MARKKKDKKKGKMVVYTPRGGFQSAARRGWAGVRGAANEIVKDKLRQSGVDIDTINRTLKDAKLPTATQLGAHVAGTIASCAHDYISGQGKSRTPFLQHDGTQSRMVGSQITKKHRTSFEYGKSNPYVLKNAAKLNGTTNLTMFDSLFETGYNEGSSARNHLTGNGGFNRKTICIWNPLQHSPTEVMSAADLTTNTSPDNKLQESYIGVEYMWRQLKIMNNSRYLTAKYTIKLYKHTQDYSTIQNTFINALASDTKLATAVQQQGALPQKYQLDGYRDEGASGAMKVWVDPRASLTNSETWNTSFDFVKSFSKTLGPGDLWEWNEKMHCGSGLKLSELRRMYDLGGRQTMGYVAVLEVVGQECAACYASNSGENFIGTAPVYFQAEIKTGGKFINAPQSALDMGANNGGFAVSKYFIRTFTNHVTQNAGRKIFNMPISSITTDPTNTAANQLFIPVMSDQTVQYAQRYRAGGTGGNEN